MAFNISGLYDNIKGSISNLLGLSDKSKLYPESSDYAKVQNSISSGNWCKLPLPYTFAVVGVASDLGGAGTFDNFKDFALPLSPSYISQTEEFAISIKPTQGGTVVTHSGNKYKTLNIEGTTGLAPFRGVGGVDKYTGEAIFAPGDLKHKSGYEVFLELRNWFKTYYEVKVHSKNARVKDARLVFKNYKDGEFLIVELLSFTMERQAGRPFLYDYKMNFKVLKHFEFSKPGLSLLESIDDVMNRSLSKIDTARGIFLRSSGILKQIEATYDGIILEPIRKIGLMLRAATGVVKSFADLPKNIARNTISTTHTFVLMTGLKDQQTENLTKSSLTEDEVILSQVKFPFNLKDAAERTGVDALLNLGEAITLIPSSDLPSNAQQQLDQETTTVMTLPRTYYEQVLADLIRVRQNAEDMFNLGDSTYDSLFDRTASIEANPDRVITEAEIDVLYGFNLAIDSFLDLLSVTNLFKSSYDAQIQDMIDKFKGEIDLSSTSSVSQIILPANMDLERIALDYLGNSEKWVEIAELNDLHIPFVTQDMTSTDTKVAKPGDTILIPTGNIFGFSATPDVVDIPSTIDLSYLEKKLGTDLKLTPNFDLSLGSRGDLEVISGGANLGQQVVLKMSYEKGELLGAPTIGSNLIIGSKTKPVSVIKDDLIQTLMQDPRVSRIADLALVQDGSAYFISFSLYVKNIDMPIPMILGI